MIYDIDFVDDEVSSQLIAMIKTIYDAFPVTRRRLRERIYKSLTRLFVVLYLKGNVFTKLLEMVVYRGITYSISTLPVVEETTTSNQSYGSYPPLNAMQTRRCYEEFYYFWRGLLVDREEEDGLKWSKGLQSIDIHQSKRYLEEMRSLVFSSIMETVITILGELNLTFKLKDDGNTTKLEDNAILHSPVDMELFLNFVEFLKLFLGRICKENPSAAKRRRDGTNPYFIQFQSWRTMLMEAVIEKSNDNPQISGLYKILETVFSLFPSGSIAMESAESIQKDVYHDSLTRDFIHRLLSKLQTFKDELLFSCISLLLHIPLSLISIRDLIPALLKSLHIGLTHIAAGELAIGVLERWNEEHCEEIKEYWTVILPHLEPFMMITKETVAGISSNNDDDDQDEGDGDDQKHNGDGEHDNVAGHHNDHRRQNAQSGKDMKLTRNDEDNLEYRRKKRLITRIMRFLGKLGGHNQALLFPKTTRLSDAAISGAEAAGKGIRIDTDIIAWDKDLRVRYKWGFKETNYTVYLDPLLPRICELAISSTNRRNKIAACEALHGIIVKMVADNATDPNQSRQQQSKKTDFEKIYNKLLPVILQLAVSVENVASQLFRPLVLQLIHWFTTNSQKDNDETIALLDAITDALGNEEDSALRDFAAECMAEFVKWSLKNKGSVRGSLNVDSLLRRLYALIRHPSPHRRKGACLCFGYIYRVIREDKLLVSRFILDILTNLVESMAIAHHDKSGIDTIEETRICIGHFVKMIVNPKHGKDHGSNLNKLDKNRKGGGHCQCLSTFIEWCFENLGRIEIQYRRQCMSLIASLAPHSRPIQNASKEPSGSVSKWFVTVIERRKLRYLVSVFEGGRMYDDEETKSVLSQFPDLKMKEEENEVSKLKKLRRFKQWTEDLSTALDDYYWMIHHEVIPLNDGGAMMTKLFTQKKFESFLFRGIQFFLGSFEKLSKVQCGGSMELKKEINRLQCDSIRRFYRLMDIMIQRGLYSVIKLFFGFEFFYQLLFQCVVTPDAVGFIQDDPSGIKSLRAQFGSVLSSICRKAEHKKNVINTICNYLSGKWTPLRLSFGGHQSRSILSIKVEDWTTSKLFESGQSYMFLLGLETLSKTDDILQSALNKLNAKTNSVAISMADDVFALCHDPLPPVQIKICCGLLSIALRLGLPSERLMLYLSDQTKIALAQSTSSKNKDERDGDGDATMDEEEEDDEEDILALMDSVNQEQIQNGCKGLVFYQRFAKVLDSYFWNHFGDFSKCILQQIGHSKLDESQQRQLVLVLSTILKHLTNETTKSKEEKQQFLTDLMQQFAVKPILDCKKEANVRQMLGIIGHFLVKCGSAAVLNGTDSKFIKIKTLIVNIYSEALKNAKQGNAQLEAIKMLPLFIVDSDDLFPWLLQAIHEMISYSFPNSSEEAYNRSKTEWRDYVEKSESILDTVILSKSITLLKVAMPLFREKEHKNKASIDEKLDGFIGAITNPLKQKECLRILSQAV